MLNNESDYIKFKSRCNVATWFDLPTLNELNENNIKIVHSSVYNDIVIEDLYLHELENITRQFLKNITAIYSMHVLNGLKTNHVIHTIKAI